MPPGSPTDIPGLEVAGTWLPAASAVTAFAVGDRAFGLVGGGGHASLVVGQERELLRCPDVLADDAAAATPEAFLTAFDAVVLQVGTRLRRHPARQRRQRRGGHRGCTDRTGARRHGGGERSHRAAPARGCGPGSRGAVRPSQAFERVAELGGADVILELVGGAAHGCNVTALARGGRLMLVAAKPGEEAHIVLRDLMMRRGHLIGTTLRTRPLGGESAA